MVCDSPSPLIRLLGGSPPSSSCSKASNLRLLSFEIAVVYAFSAVTGGFPSDNLPELLMSSVQASKRQESRE